MKHAVCFIHGFNKTPDTWNQTEAGKNINIEKIISGKEKVKTLLVRIDNFKISPQILVTQLVEQMKSEPNKWTIVCHSLGVVYGLELLNHDITINGFCLVDPTSLNEEYIREITDSSWEEGATYCLNNFVKKVDYPAKIIFHIHLDYDIQDQIYFCHQIQYYKQFVGKNTKSKIIVHPGKGHMIHYTDTAKIIESILSLLKN